MTCLFNINFTRPFVHSHVALDRLFDGGPCDLVRHNLSFWGYEGLVHDKSSSWLRVSSNWAGDCYGGIRKSDIEYSVQGGSRHVSCKNSERV